jgi:hypothetical protein
VTHEEKRAWILMVVTVLSYGAYLLTILARARGHQLAQVHYAATLLTTVGAAILASILAEIGIAVVSPRASRDKDVRDRQIARLGDRVGQAFVIIAAVAAMLMAMADWRGFWIANVIYLGFALSAVLGSITRIAIYRGTFPQW